MPLKLVIDDTDQWLADWLADAADQLGAGLDVELERLEAEHPSRARRARRLLPALESTVHRSADQERAFAPGVERTLGDFQILRVIGQGGMGTVYEAVQISLNRRVALKILPSLAARDPLKLKRFQIEAQAAACLNHPHIVPVHLVEECQGVHYFAMKLVEGRTLAEAITQSRRRATVGSATIKATEGAPDALELQIDLTGLEPNEALFDGDDHARFRLAAEFARQAADALHFAHQQGILHRDVKPSNLMVDRAGCLYIVDFGLARIAGEVDLTQSGALIGTLRYMSPEQASSARVVVDHRADVYSLGAVLFEMLTLRAVFECEDRLELLDRIAIDDPTPPRRLNPAIPRDLETITLKATAKERADRYATAQDFANDLERFLQNRPIHAVAPSHFDRACKWARRHRAAVRLSLVALSTFALALGIAVAWRYSLLNRHYVELRSALDMAERSEASTQRLWYDSQVRMAHQASDAGQVEFAQELLSSLRRRPDGEDPRGFEWHYLWRLCQRDFSVLSRHDRPVGTPVLSPGGRTLATTDDDGIVVLWDLVAGRERFRRRAHAKGVSGLVFSPDGATIASWSSPGGGFPSEVKLWDAAARDEPWVVPGIIGYVTTVSFAHDGAKLAIVEHKGGALDHSRATIWTLAGGRTLVAPAAPPLAASAFAYSTAGPDFAFLGPDGKITLSVRQNRLTRLRLTLPLSGERALLFAPDGRTLAAAGDDGVALFDAESGRQIASFKIAALGRPAFSNDGRWFADLEARSNHVILIENPAANPRLFEPPIATPRDPRIAFSRTGGLLAVTGRGAPPTIWDLNAEREVHRFPGVITSPSAPVFTRDDESLLFASDDGRVRAWRFGAPPSVSDSFLAHKGEAWAVFFTPDGKHLVSAGDDHKIKVWDARDHTLIRTLEGHDSLVASLAINRAGTVLASAGFDKSVRLWDLSKGTPGLILNGHSDRVRSVVFLEPGSRAASAGSDGVIRLWDSRSGATLEVDHHHSKTVRALAADPLGRYVVSAGDDRMIRVWNLVDDAKSFSAATPKQNSALAISRDGARLAVGDDWGDVTLWDATTWTVISTVKASDAVIRGLAFPPGGRSLAAACDDAKIRLWDPVTGQVTLVLEARGGRVNAVAFSPDGLTLASASHDGSITLWRAGEP